MNNQNNTPVSSLRFTSANTEQLTADQLDININELRARMPKTTSIVSVQDIFGDDRNHSPTGYHLATVIVDGKTILLKDILRGVGNAVGGEYGQSKDCLELARYFGKMADDLTAAAEVIDATREKNLAIKDNNLEIENTVALRNAQWTHENNLSEYQMSLIESQEQAIAANARIVELENNVTSLTGKLKGLVSKVTRKAPAKSPAK